MILHAIFLKHVLLYMDDYEVFGSVISLMKQAQ